jgi:hypothetical protein
MYVFSYAWVFSQVIYTPKERETERILKTGDV